MDFCFFIDIVLTFFTATQENKISPVILDKRALARNYLQGWFMIDVFTTIPFQISERIEINVGDAAEAKVLRLARIPRLYRLIRLFRLMKIKKL